MAKRADEELEWQTRKLRIDGRLERQGWKIVPADAPKSGARNI